MRRPLRSHRPRTTEVDRALRATLRRLPPSGDLGALVQQLSHDRDRPLDLVEYPFPEAGPSGSWLSFPDHDYILVAAAAPPSLKAAIICHEIGHVVLGHEPPRLTDHLASVAPDVAPHIAMRFLARHQYDDDQEQQAEMFGTLLATESGRRTSTTTSFDTLADRLH